MSTVHHNPAPVHSNPFDEPQCEESYFGEESAWLAEQLGDFDATPPGEPELPFADWVECQASYFRSLGTDAAAWLASEVQHLADLARSLGAETPDQFITRQAVLDLDALERERSRAASDAYDLSRGTFSPVPARFVNEG